jgi:hypothetical protein
VLHDVSINANHGVFYNEPKLAVPGMFASTLAVRFRDTRSSYARISTHPALNLTSASIGLSFRARELEGFQGLLAKDHEGHVPGDLSIYLEDNQVVARFQSTGRDEVSRPDLTAPQHLGSVVTLCRSISELSTLLRRLFGTQWCSALALAAAF